MSELPKVFQNNTNNLSSNDQETFASFNHKSDRNTSNIASINKIFDKDFMYKRKVKIIFNNNIEKDEYIVSRSKNSLITINNEKISIEDIKNISLL